MTIKSDLIKVETVVNAPVEKVWEYWTDPKHIVKWNNASEDWHTTEAKNDLKIGGKFTSRMEAKDGSFGFDFGGVYTEVRLYEVISYVLDDGRKVEINFINEENKTKIIENFEGENENPPEFQQMGWQAILDNFKKYSEQVENIN
ncbi:SRPBCC family protein [uncultured Clostridium sp.]|uniref:SRPBCC family protein n=1 Tax=uncultured Clostridium sp. TaxID=59620 RepID=UPI00280AEE0C|nr:SRPBCC family protein [uncultured Clostridium sp.]